MAVTGAGFAPGDPIELETTLGNAFGSATADADGNIETLMTAPALATNDLPAESAFTLTATDPLHPLAVTPTTRFLVANLAVEARPANALPGTRVTWTFSGFTTGAKIYGHYLHGTKVTATATFGRATGPCGVLKVKALVYPGHEKYGSYKIQIDDSRRYSPRTVPRWLGKLLQIRR
ncbi:MAG TPA: hypothetical protein VG388_02880 [Solirubrobacteraceae bacterium]|jgi:hypothetical protein|nr:hypothetical protein [Solirubrobacteraceae bacterium]